MKKMHSKRNTNKKNNTIGAISEGKKNNRVYKASSCVKINLQNTQQHSSSLTLQQTLSKSNLQNNSQKMIAQLTQASCQQTQRSNLRLIERSYSHFKTKNNQNAKISIQTIPNNCNRGQLLYLRQISVQLSKQNFQLKRKFSELQQLTQKDKEKIKNLIIRINQVKNNRQMTSQAKSLFPSTSKIPNCLFNATDSYSFFSHKNKLQTSYKNTQNRPCERQDCIQHKKYLQDQLYYERQQRENLQIQHREWQRNRESLKQQYNKLLDQIKTMRRESQF